MHFNCAVVVELLINDSGCGVVPNHEGCAGKEPRFVDEEGSGSQRKRNIIKLVTSLLDLEIVEWWLVRVDKRKLEVDRAADQFFRDASEFSMPDMQRVERPRQ